MEDLKNSHLLGAQYNWALRKISKTFRKCTICSFSLLLKMRMSLNAITAIITDPDWLSQLKEGYLQDPETKKMLDNDSTPENLLIDDGLIYLIQDTKTRLWIPNVPALQTKILAAHHDGLLAGHLGMDKTYLAIAENYYWPKLRDSVRDYVQSCIHCQRNKPTNQKPAGLLQPLPIPAKLWEQISMDLIVQLPKTPRGNDSPW